MNSSVAHTQYISTGYMHAYIQFSLSVHCMPGPILPFHIPPIGNLPEPAYNHLLVVCIASGSTIILDQVMEAWPRGPCIAYIARSQQLGIALAYMYITALLHKTALPNSAGTRSFAYSCYSPGFLLLSIYPKPLIDYTVSQSQLRQQISLRTCGHRPLQLD